MQPIFLLVPFLLAIVFYNASFGDPETAKQFISVSTFIFAIFTGFFIAKQGRRYDDIIRTLTQFDGNVSALYRLTGHLGKQAQEKMTGIIQAYYKPMLEHHAWDYNIMHKSSLMTSTHALLAEATAVEKLSDLQRAAVTRVLTALDALQGLRKQLVALHEDRVPRFQWLLIVGLGAILLVTIATLPSKGAWLPSFLKATYATAILLVIYMVWALDQLKFFSNAVGEHSARDVADILSGKK